MPVPSIYSEKKEAFMWRHLWSFPETELKALHFKAPGYLVLFLSEFGRLGRGSLNDKTCAL